MENEKEILMRLESMIGKAYEYEGVKVHINDVLLKGSTATLITDSSTIQIRADELDEELIHFKLVSDNALKRNGQVLDMIMNSNSTYDQIQKTLLDSIEKIQQDPAYIPQASAVNATIKNVIDLEKVRISTLSLLKG